MTKQTLNILIGDDEFKDFLTERIFKQNYVSQLKEQTPGYEFNWRYETDSQSVIRQATTGTYDIIVTDLDYSGGGRGKEGYEVIDMISKMNPRPILILCTSCDNEREIEEKTRGKIDFRAGGTGKGHKFSDLVEILSKHLNKTK
jgi:hypothetical protein